jgi:4-amino-4-deoxy-L-arabinose transferase-like glycosyltransferase
VVSAFVPPGFQLCIAAMKQVRLLTAIYVVAAILLAAHSFHTVYADHEPLGRWVKTIIYGSGPWLCAFAFAGAKIAFQILLRKETKGFRNTFTWVSGVVIGLMIFTKIMA